MTHPKQNASVLLVENDAALRDEIHRHLQEQGYAVICAASQAEAETWIGKQPFDLLITDLILEFSDSGFIICHHFRKAYPASRAILLSDVAAKTGMQFDLSGENARDWIHADAIMDQTIRMEQLDCLLSHLLS